MSSTASPEETPVDASPDHSDGGSSNSLTQGEIIFVTLLSFVVLLACILGTYAVCRRHQKQKQPTDQKDDAQRLASDGQGTDIVVDFEASGSLDHQGGDAEKAKIITRETLQHQVSGGPLLRRASMESNRNVKRMKGQESRRATMDSEGSRHANMGALGSNVSSRYKHAAIEHMNKISQTGRHESGERRGTL